MKIEIEEEQIKEMQKKNKVKLIVIVLSFIFLFILLIVINFYIINSLSHQEAYYKTQAINLCEMSNAYRELVLTLNPEMELEIPSALNCDVLFLTDN